MACEVRYTGEEMNNSIQLDGNAKKKTYIEDSYSLTNHSTCFKLKCLKCDEFSHDSSL